SAQKSGTKSALRAVLTRGPRDAVAAGDDGTIRHTTDGKTWRAVDGARGTASYRALFGSGDDVYAVDSALLVSHDGGASFAPLAHAPWFVVLGPVTAGGDVYFAAWNGVVSRSGEPAFTPGRRSCIGGGW